MEELYDWIKGITYYLIFMTVAVNLLPDKKYEKYLRFFAGMVLILLVLKPLTGGLRLDDRLAYYFESISFKKEAGELTGEISKMENQRLLAMISKYEEAVGMDLKSMAETGGFRCEKVRAQIDQDENSPSFGHVQRVSLVLSGREGEEETAGAAVVEKIEQVEIGSVNPQLTAEEKTGPGEPREQKTKENSRLSGLRRRIAEYYDLEEQDIEIQMENG